MRSLAMLLLTLPSAVSAEPPPNRDLLELVGAAREHEHLRPFLDYYVNDDFTFVLDDVKTGKTWRVLSREVTPNYDWRMGPTYTGLKVSWGQKPRVRVIGVPGIDRLPARFYNRKLDDPHLMTALIVSVESRPGDWQDYYVNNWFHKWGPKADSAVHRLFADRKDPYRIYGFARDQAAPFDARSQAILDQHRANPSLTFHGRVKSAKNAFGYELELIDLIGRDVATGGPKLLHGDARSIPLLDKKKPAQ